MSSSEMTPLSSEDARILALETGPIRGHTLKMLLIEDSLGDDALPMLRKEISRRLPEAPRWKQRLVNAPESPTGLAWQDDPAFDIARHVQVVSEKQPVDELGLRRIVSGVMTIPLDRTRPLWEVSVVPRLENGRWAVIWKVHHSLADGMTMMHAGARLLWTEENSKLSAQHALHSSEEKSPALLARSARLATLLGYRGVVLREFHRVHQLSPLAETVGPHRATAFTQLSLEDLRSLGKAIDPEVTINDVLLTIVAGALRRWLQEEHSYQTQMKAQVPVSLHPHLGEDDPFGNRDSFLFVDLPLSEGDPIARVRAISQETKLRKNRHDARAIYAMEDHLSHAPALLRESFQKLVQGPHEYSLNISNVPGPSGPIHVLGRRVSAMVSFAEIAPYHALRVAAVSLNGSLFIGLCADPHVVPDLNILTGGIHQSVDELRRASKN